MDKNLIYDLLDGNLNETEKIEVFKLLSENKDLREEFSFANQLKNSLNENKDNFIIPTGSKEEIFGNIGLNLPNVNTSSSIFASKAFVGIFSSILTFVLISSIYFYNINIKENKFTKDEPNFEILKSQIKLPSINNDYVNERLIANNESKDKNDILIQDKQLDIDEKNYSNENVNEKSSKLLTISKSELSSLHNIDKNYVVNSDKPSLNYMSSNLEDPILTKFYIELTNSVNQNFPNETISPSNIQKFNNSNISIFFELNDKLNLGIDFRNENFFQRYEDELYQYEQTPNFTTYSLTARYNFLKNLFYNDLNAYSQIGIGINQGGVVSRASLGLFYELSKGFGINSSLEYSNLFFKNNFNTFYSHKISINYGIRYKF